MAIMRKSSVLSFFIYLLSLLPFWAIYVLSDIGYVVLRYVIGYRKAVVHGNLKNAFPEKSPAERKAIARKFYRFLPDLIVEAIKMRSISPKEATKRMRLCQLEELERHFRAGKGVIVVTAHYANWEMGIHAISLYTTHPALIVYKPLRDKSFDTVFNAIRSRFGAIMVPMKQTLRQIVAHRHQPHLSVFVADQTPSRRDTEYFIRFLNQDTPVYTGPEKIAKTTGFPVVFCHIDRVKRGHYTGTFTTLVETPSEVPGNGITDLHNNMTEEIIRRKPELWLWSHRRWKKKPTR